MRFALGTTRVVLLIGDSAIKIGYVRPIKFFFKLLVLPFSEEDRLNFARKYHSGFIKAAWLYLLAGPLANINEYRYFNTYGDSNVAPVKRLFFWGIVCIQERGSRINEEELNSFFRECMPFPVYDAKAAKQFCRLKNGKIVLADYGNLNTTGDLIALHTSKQNSYLAA